MAFDDRRQRLDHRLETLPRRDQPERREQEARSVGTVFRADRGAVALVAGQRGGRGALRKHRRCPVRHHTNLLLGAGATGDEEVPRGVRHHDHKLGLAAHGRQHLRLVRRRLRQHRVECHDERLRQLLDQRSHVATVAAAEDPVLVLKQDDIDIEPAKNPGSAYVVAPNRLGDRRREPRPLRTGGLVHDHDLLDAIDLVQAEEGRADVRRKGADPAGARWVGRDDRGAHLRTRVPSVEFPARRRSVSTASSLPP